MGETPGQRWLIRAGLLALLCWSLGPWLYMVAVSVSVRPDAAPWSPHGGLTFRHFETILTTPSLHVLAYLRNSLIVSGLSAVLAVGVSGLAAFAISRLALPGRVGILLAVLSASLFPQISVVGWLFGLMGAWGWVNTYQALVLPYIGWVLPLTLWILVSYGLSIPKDLDRAAMVDGCTSWQLLRYVIAPLAVPGMVSAGILAALFAMNEFMFALMLTTDHHARTVPVGMAMFQGLHGEMPWGELMAAATVATLPIVAVAVFCQRWIIRGLTRGAVKG